MFFDSHAHLTDDRLFPDIDSILSRSSDAGVSTILNICTDETTLQRGLQLHKKYPWVYQAAATPPHDVERDGERLFPLIAEKARSGQLTAVGESGLDYFYHQETKELQQKIFCQYILLAKECKLPLVVHCREAFADFFTMIDAEYRQGPGVLHCFTGTQKEAEGVIERGWYLSLSGIVTYKKSGELREVAKWVPLEQLLIETDSPYLAPQTKRGEVNESSFLPEIARTIAESKGISVDEVALVTTQNAKKLLNL